MPVVLFWNRQLLAVLEIHLYLLAVRLGIRLLQVLKVCFQTRFRQSHLLVQEH
jgi:hypothetical protein